MCRKIKQVLPRKGKLLKWSSVGLLSVSLLSVPMLLHAEEGELPSFEQVQEAAVISQKNLLTNGDFSQTSQQSGDWTGLKATSWNVWIDGKYKQNSPSRKIEVENGYLKITSAEPLRAVVHQEVVVDASKKYTVRFKIKTTDKTGVARVRIIEGEGENKNLWYSKEVTGTNDWQEIEADYIPISTASKIKIELFYETGHGEVYFDDLALLENGDKEVVPPKDMEKELESQVSVPQGKHYFLAVKDYDYQIADENLATVKDGMITALKEGGTTLSVSQNGQLLKTIPLTISSSVRDNYSQLLEDWNDIIAGNRFYQADNQRMLAFHQELEKKVEQSLQTLAREENRTYLWKEYSNYEKSSHITSTYRKIEEIAKQVKNPHSAYYNHPEVIRTVREALEWLHQHVYNPSKSIAGNWWDYEIGSPRALNNTLSLLQDYFSDEEIKNYTDVIEKFVPDPTYFRKTTSPFEALGGNLVDMGRVKIIAGLLRKDQEEIAATVTSIEKLFTLVTSGEGFYPDGSYIAHTNVAYTGAYGSVLIDGLSQLLPIIQKTATPIAAEKLQTIYHWVDHSFFPLIVHGELMDLSRGRSISRANSQSHVAAVEALRGIHRIAEMSDSETKQRLKSKIKTIVEKDSFYSVYDNLKTYRDIRLMEDLLGDASIPLTNPESHLSTFNGMDKLAHYDAERGFGFGLSLFSSRTKNYESMNQENRKGWYTGDGMFYLYNGDLSHYSNHYWATVNPYKMPGTTETDAERELDSGQGVLPSSFVGMTKLDEKNGLAAMDFTNWNQTVSAHKGWFVLNGKIVFLGSQIQNQSSDMAYTTIDQRKVDSGFPYTVYVNGVKETVAEKETSYPDTKSLFLESTDTNRNIGYFFFKKKAIHLQKQVQTGSWKGINASQPATPESNEFITITQQHQGKDDDYAYALIPNVDRSTFEKLSQEMEQALLENSGTLQVVYDASQQIWGIIKYDDTTSTISNAFQVHKKGLYMIRKDKESYQVAYYDPENQTTRPTEEVFQELKTSPSEPSPKETPPTPKESSPSDSTQTVGKKEPTISQRKYQKLPRTGETASLYTKQVGIGFVILSLVSMLYQMKKI